MTQLPIPAHFSPNTVGEIWRVPYQQRAIDAQLWAKQHQLNSVAATKPNVKLLLIDVQNTFCQPDFELFVGGRSGRGAIDDNIRLCEFIYRNLGDISQIIATLDTHHIWQIFHPIFWVDERGEHPAPMTMILPEDVKSGKWQIDAQAPETSTDLAAYALHYVEQLTSDGKYPLLIWPYHAMLGGIGHALVPAVEEAIFFHGIARNSQPSLPIKGDRSLTENYSALAPEVMTNQFGEPVATRNTQLIDHLLASDVLIIAGQAQSHCVAWTVNDLLTEIQAVDPHLARKVYLLADCTSPVVIPGVVDYTDQADIAYQKFADAGMNIVRSTDTWTFSSRKD